MMRSLLLSLLFSLALMLFSPLLAGLEQWIAAWMQGRTRSWRFLLQPYRDLWKLFGIPPARPETASWLFAAVPPLLFGVNALLLFALPFGAERSFLALSPILLVYLLALHRFLFSLAGLDGAAPFGGLGGPRTMFLNFLSEVNFFLWIAALALYWQGQDASTETAYLNSLIHAHSNLGWGVLSQPQLLLLAVVLGLLILYELERPPVGDPDSHLELTMGEKAVILAWQGRDLALVKAADMLRLGFFMALFAALFLPGGWPWPLAWLDDAILLYAFFPLKILFVTLAMTLIVSTRSKLRLGRVAGPAFFAGALSLLSIVLTISFHLYLQTGGGG